ncbi:hypothetical protein BgiMline_002678, partial [Biomphalaria glabrata]
YAYNAVVDAALSFTAVEEWTMDEKYEEIMADVFGAATKHIHLNPVPNLTIEPLVWRIRLNGSEPEKGTEK